jgi:hypothetical protein
MITIINLQYMIIYKSKKISFGLKRMILRIYKKNIPTGQI